MYFEVPQDSYPQETWGGSGIRAEQHGFPGPLSAWLWIRPKKSLFDITRSWFVGKHC